MKLTYLWTVTTGCLVILMAGCPAPNTFVAPPDPTVTVAPPDQRDVTVYADFPGRTEASDTVEIRARVRGFLEEITFEDGDRVDEGQHLFTIEQAPYQASLDSAKASLAQAVASRRLADTTYRKNQEAYKSRAVSEIDVLAAEAELKSAAAGVQVAEATIKQAELDLGYTAITAPMAGSIARRYVSVGNLVDGSPGTLLTTLVLDNPLYVYFNFDERTALPFMMAGPRTEDPGSRVPPITLELADGSHFDKPARVDYLDPEFDPDTGTVSVRAVVDNSEGKLLPGMFIRVLIPQERPDAILAPELCIQRDLAGPFVLVVNDEGEVESRYVELGPQVDEERIIEEGLEAGARLIVDGLQRARPGITVNAVAADDAASAGADGE